MNILKIIFILFSIMVINCICMGTYACSSEDFIQQQKTTEIMELLDFNGEADDETFKKWDKYIKERTHRFNNGDYQMAINELKFEYDESYKMLNSCIKITDKEAEKYSSTWLKDLQKQFSKKVIDTNIDHIKFIIIAIWMDKSHSSCEDESREALYREYLHLDAAKYYVKEYVEFSETLKAKDKDKIKATISIAKSYLENFEYPLQAILSDGGLKKALFSVSLKTRKDLNPQLIEFLTQHPFFQKPFAIVKTIEDLKTLR